MSNQYDRDRNAKDRQGYHKFDQINKDVRFDPQARHNDIASGKFPKQIDKDMTQARQEKHQQEQNRERTQQAGGSSSAGGKGKEVRRPYDPVRDAASRQ
ncbi:hypothetical protein BOTCAL_0544g00100 [Botryotinia calthae]|uniref:Uncharacterized protein n=1 Tax=Botryotinia calthae TaxID=38488 RepID=A0A4Y8CK89_9HELO|nr:hypothetical protein BOTCAL_0544g00100 [Botryotinia calthae]